MALDFSGQNLRGRNFKGRKDLAGADFSDTDIRGANFTNANLTGANFSHAQAGLQNRSKTALIIFSLSLSVFFGIIAWKLNDLVGAIWGFTSNDVFAGLFSIYPRLLVCVVLLVFFLVARRWGAVSALATLGGICAVIALLTGNISGSINATGASTGALVGIVVLVVAIAVNVTVSGIVAGEMAAFLSITLTVIGSVFEVVVQSVPFIQLAFEFVGGLESFTTYIFPEIQRLGTTVISAVAVALLGGYMAWGTLKVDEKYLQIRKIAVTFAAMVGTSFRGADLTDANSTAAMLKGTDFRKANVTHTCWFKAKNLELTRVGMTYLQNQQIRQLLITGQGQDKNFDRENLRGINLQKANLADASFIGADLSEANLQDADLSRAKLKQTQLDATDLTGATLTGAYIEDWGITRETKLYGVRCEYVFMRLPTKEDPDPLRKPDNKQEVFEDGDFAEFIQPIFDTLDLYHHQGVDPRAVAIAFKNLAENHPDAELEIVAMEKRGHDKLLLRAKTAAGSDKSQLSAEYFADYNQLKALQQSQQLLLLEKSDRIRNLENMITTALQQPKFYTQGDTNVSDISGINIQNSSNVSGIAGGGSVANLGTISGNVSIALNQLPDSTNADKPGIKELLSQLQDAITQSSDLPAEDKAEALEQVKTLAEAGQNPQEATKQKTAKMAITMLKGIFAGLPAVATLVEAGNKLLPAIAKLFNLA